MLYNLIIPGTDVIGGGSHCTLIEFTFTSIAEKSRGVSSGAEIKSKELQGKITNVKQLARISFTFTGYSYTEIKKKTKDVKWTDDYHYPSNDLKDILYSSSSYTNFFYMILIFYTIFIGSVRFGYILQYPIITMDSTKIKYPTNTLKDVLYPSSSYTTSRS